jgi:hypothetical protein
MNKKRLAAIHALEDELQDVVARALELSGDAMSLRDEEREYLDNMPESLQDGDKGQRAEAAIEILDAIIEALEELQNVQSFTDVE